MPSLRIDYFSFILHKERDTVKKSSFNVGRAIEVSIGNSAGGHFQTAGKKYPKIGRKNFVKRSSFLIMSDRPHRVLHFLPEFRGFCPFLDYQTARGNLANEYTIFSSLQLIIFH